VWSVQCHAATQLVCGRDPFELLLHELKLLNTWFEHPSSHAEKLVLAAALQGAGVPLCSLGGAHEVAAECADRGS
jgi:hypothetical protein